MFMPTYLSVCSRHLIYLCRTKLNTLKNLERSGDNALVENTPSADSYRLRQHTRVVQTPTLNDTVDTWAELEKLHASGRAPAITVSNFSVKTLEELLQTAKIVPAVNEVECGNLASTQGSAQRLAHEYFNHTLGFTHYLLLYYQPILFSGAYGPNDAGSL
ncbi:hypothetical protein C8J57DRAFT_1233246 [Mycena rebaudengoi]|nr:hypothetical protein C8J57DRAFT_1233246 [Mycena rebaudengoi]